MTSTIHYLPKQAAVRVTKMQDRPEELCHAAAARAGGVGPLASTPTDIGPRQVRACIRGRTGCARRPPGGKPEVIFIGSGSELSLCVKAYEKLLTEGIRSRVVSMPSWEIFEHQSQAYQDSILLLDVTARVAVEQASTFGWERYVSKSGRVIGMKTFGASAPLKELQRKFGFEPERVTEIAKELISKCDTR